jgi:hypothetical protein
VQRTQSLVVGAASLCAPLPISAITRLSRRASQRAAIAEVAAVRSAVVTVSSESTSG